MAIPFSERRLKRPFFLEVCQRGCALCSEGIENARAVESIPLFFVQRRWEVADEEPDGNPRAGRDGFWSRRCRCIRGFVLPMWPAARGAGRPQDRCAGQVRYCNPYRPVDREGTGGCAADRGRMDLQPRAGTDDSRPALREWPARPYRGWGLRLL